MSEKKNIRFLSSEFLWLIGILLLGALLRLIVVSSIPNGLYQDETAIGYNAYSILKTGFDEHHQFLPLYFKSFGDYKLPLYIYLTAGSIFLFGLNEFAVRFPSILFGILAVLGIYQLTKELTKNTRLSLISSLLLAINPWHMHFSRAGFEVNVAVTLLLFGVVF